MINEWKGTTGAAIQALGTILAAIGSTPITKVSTDMLHHLRVWGNVLQASGSALQADSEDERALSRLGNQIQAVGNSTVVTGLVIPFDNIIQQKLIINGDWLQALGGLIIVGDELENIPSIRNRLNIIGNLLQAIGNSLQAIGGTIALEEDKSFYHQQFYAQRSLLLGVSGSWIQAVGAVISLIAQVIGEE